ncbi:MAG: aminotransferase class I/II-fold pyridoxal phosphate-dependent enzyme [Kiritimatiellae bacterium]|nr:aminotransferase class I/II-fold pyridoxal phosphate-dependent enzyme [Kiritimatiellia bacterium]
MPNTIFNQAASELLQGLRAAGTEKRLRYLGGPMGAVVRLEGYGEVVVLCSNNYLGLANHPEVVAAGREGLERYGAGTASVRFICGTLDCHQRIERSLAEMSGTEAALTYTSCWNANEAAIATLVGPEDTIISDELNHASIIDGCRLAKARERLVYPHGDLGALEKLLRDHAAARVRWVITDGVFSMEGAVADLRAMLELCRRYEAMLVLDDSHGVGVLGATGRGSPEFAGVLGQIDVITGTLGKALGGGAGGYVAAGRQVVDLLVQRSRPSLFSNALPATVACSANRAIEILRRDTSLVERLHGNIRRVRDGLRALGFECGASPSAIIPIAIGDEAEAIRKSERLLELGVWVVAFGYPVVPKGRARLRVQVSAALDATHIQRVLDAFAKL